MNNGSKWSKLAKICSERTEHNLKNRFFSLLSNHFAIPIVKLKKEFDFFNSKLIQEVITSLQ